METTFTVDKTNLDVVTSRVFSATPERLWEAQTDPEQIQKWWGPGELSTVIEKNEVQVGGGWRYIQHAPDGSVHAFRGEYKEVDKPHKIVRTFEYEPMAGHILVETMTLEAMPDNTTKMTSTAHYANLEDLEGMVSMGMEGGQRESYERMAALVSA
ncbi:MAG: SRPBCC domain-containing protein [Candidatus Saccharibacteria bacterium]